MQNFEVASAGEAGKIHMQSRPTAQSALEAARESQRLGRTHITVTPPGGPSMTIDQFAEWMAADAAQT